MSFFVVQIWNFAFVSSSSLSHHLINVALHTFHFISFHCIAYSYTIVSHIDCHKWALVIWSAHTLNRTDNTVCGWTAFSWCSFRFSRVSPIVWQPTQTGIQFFFLFIWLLKFSFGYWYWNFGSKIATCIDINTFLDLIHNFWSYSEHKGNSIGLILWCHWHHLCDVCAEPRIKLNESKEIETMHIILLLYICMYVFILDFNRFAIHWNNLTRSMHSTAHEYWYEMCFGCDIVSI